MKNLQAHSDHVWQNDVGRESVGKACRQDPGKSVVRGIENDKDDQPNASYAQTEDEKPLAKQRERSQNSRPRMAPATLPHFNPDCAGSAAVARGLLIVGCLGGGGATIALFARTAKSPTMPSYRVCRATNARTGVEAVVEGECCSSRLLTFRSFGGGTYYSEIGAVLFETAVEAGITVVIVIIHRAQH